jgi:hypothetical protein
LKLINLGENVMNLLQQKVGKNVAISLGYFIFSKNHNEPPKVAQLVKNRPIGSPCLQQKKLIKNLFSVQLDRHLKYFVPLNTAATLHCKF